MKLILATIALLFATLPPPAGAQTKAKGKSSATKAAEESRKQDETAESKKGGGSAKESAESTASKSKGSGSETAAKKPVSSTASTKKAGEGITAKKATEGPETKKGSVETTSKKGSESGEETTKKTAAGGASKKKASDSSTNGEAAESESKTSANSAASGAKKPSTGKTKGKSAASGEDSDTQGTAKKKPAGTDRKSDQDDVASSETGKESLSGSGSKSSSKSGKTASKANGTRKNAIDKPPQDNAGEEPTRKSRVIGPNITLDPDDLANFYANSKAVQRLLNLGLQLTRQGLTYRYGSSDPSSGGMDCSGTIYYLLKAAGVKEPPRDSSGLYLWAQKEGTLRQVNPTSLDDPALADLRPGDLMFWEGTYEVQRDPPISHTMIYLGKEKATGMPVMVGASDGRTYGGVSRNGVSVFDFKLPRSDSAARFVAYGRVPGIENLGNGTGK